MISRSYQRPRISLAVFLHGQDSEGISKLHRIIVRDNGMHMGHVELDPSTGTIYDKLTPELSSRVRNRVTSALQTHRDAYEALNELRKNPTLSQNQQQHPY